MNGEVLYNVYGAAVGFKNFQGNPMPEWADLPDAIKHAWEAVARAKVEWTEGDDEREDQ